MTKKIEVFASEALPGELEDFPDIKRGWGTTKELTGGIPPMKWFNAIQKRTDEAINAIANNSINSYTFKDGGVANSVNDWFEFDGVFYYAVKDFPVVVNGGSNPNDSGGIITYVDDEAVWVKVSDNLLRGELLSDGGASMVGLDSGCTVQDYLISPLSNYNKSVKTRLPVFFDGYDEALKKIKDETDGKGSINPDGMDIDDDGNYFISCPTSIGDMKSSSALVIVYSKSGNTLTYFWMPPSASTLSFRVRGSSKSGWRVYGRSLDSLDTNYNVSTLIYWDLSELPNPGETLSIDDSKKTNFPVGQLFDVKGKYVLSVVTRKALASVTFCRVSVFDMERQRIINEFFIPKTLISYDTQTAWVDDKQYSVNDIYKNTWKIQDFAYNENNNTFLFSVGGVYQVGHQSNGNKNDTYHDIGLFEVNSKGDLLRSSVVKVGGFIDALGESIGDGGKVEMEGVSSVGGNSFSCVVVNSNSDTKKGEYLIIKEFSNNSEKSFNLGEYASKHGVFRGVNYDGLSGASGRILNPITQLPFSNINEVFDFMVFLDVPKISFHVKNEMELFVGVTELSNLLNQTAKIEIECVNAGTRFIVNIKSSQTTLTSFYVYGNIKNWTLQRIPTISHSIKLTQPGTITATSDTEGDMGVLSSNITHSNRTVTIGDGYKYGGSGDIDYVSPNRIFINTSKSYSDSTSRTSLNIQYSSVTPGVDSDITLGSSSNKWKDIYASNGAIVTSDSRCKVNVVDISEAEKKVALQLKSSMKKYKMRNSVNEKGSKARWHFGIIAQEVIKIFDDNGLDAMDYGVICYDEWKDGGEIKSSYAVRYDELICFIIYSI